MRVDLSRTCLPVLAVTLSIAGVVSHEGVTLTAADPLAAVKALYLSADYEQALVLLSTLDVGSGADEADEYRALCLLALGRMAEVEDVLESLIVRNPAFRMSSTEVPPRLVAMFEEAHTRLLPDLLWTRYAAARVSFEDGDYLEASSRFRALSTLLADERLPADETVAGTADLRMLVEGFLKLADAAVAAAEADTGTDVDDEAVSTASSMPAIDRDEAAVGEVVLQYTRAYSALDADAVAGIFQTVDRRALQAAFNGLTSQTIEARDVTITIDAGGQSAGVTLTWVVDAVPKVGDSMTAEMPVMLRMRKSPTGGWLIVERR
jgi:ketosteroid isomerase-like protein